MNRRALVVTIAALALSASACASRTSGAESFVGSESESGEPPPDLPAACEPDGDASVGFDLLGLEFGQNELDLACTFTGVAPAGEAWRYELDACSSLVGGEAPAQLSLELTSAPAVTPIIDPGTVVRLRYARSGADLEAEAESFVLTAQPGALLLLAGHVGEGYGLDPDPIVLTVEPRACGRISDVCFDRFDQRLAFAFGGAQIELIAGQSAVLGEQVSYQVVLEFAAEFVGDPDCATPDGAVSAYLIALLPEG